MQRAADVAVRSSEKIGRLRKWRGITRWFPPSVAFEIQLPPPVRAWWSESDIQVLMAVGKLTPLGDPAPNAPKWFGAVEMIRLAADQDWLHKATKEISKYWRHKRERRQISEPL